MSGHELMRRVAVLAKVGRATKQLAYRLEDIAVNHEFVDRHVEALLTLQADAGDAEQVAVMLAREVIHSPLAAGKAGKKEVAA